MTTAILTFRDVRFTYPGGQTVLQDLSLELPEGAFAVLQGPSGSGKSTLLRLACGLAAPDSGSVLFAGRPVAEYDPPLLRRQAIYLHQEPTLVDGTVRDNLLLPFAFAANRDLPRPDDAHLRERLGRFLLPDVDLGRPAGDLSGGQKQRLCLIRAMLLAPRLLLLDEPVSALDPDSAEAVLEAVEEAHLHEGASVLLVSHAPVRPSRASTSFLRMAGGKVVPA